jgi:hypothetical protein
MSKLVRVVLVVMGLPFVAACAGSEGRDGAMSGLGMTGDENGGTIPRSVGGAASQASAYETVTAHCAKFGKKGFITKMDFETGTMAFECRQQKGKA